MVGVSAVTSAVSKAGHWVAQSVDWTDVPRADLTAAEKAARSAEKMAGMWVGLLVGRLAALMAELSDAPKAGPSESLRVEHSVYQRVAQRAENLADLSVVRSGDGWADYWAAS